MKRFLSILALCFTAVATLCADELVSGEYYRICSLDGLTAMSNGGSTANNKVLNMQAIDLTDEGQVWQLTQSNGYWQIKSAVGDVCADNPSESHSKWSNQLIQWKTSGGNNQKWTFQAIDDAFYMIPYESTDKSKGYGYADNGNLTYQTKGAENTRFYLKRVVSKALERTAVNGYYALQAVSAYPDYLYKSEGRFLSFSKSGTPSFTDGYTYDASRLLLSTDEDGVLRITLPQRDMYVYATSSSLRLSATADESHADAAVFALFCNEDELGLNSRVCLHVGNDSPSNTTTTLKVLYPATNGSGVSVTGKVLGNAYVFRLVKLPAGAETERLAALVDEASALLEGEITDEERTALQAAIDEAVSERDYPYLTAKDVDTQVQKLKEAVSNVSSSSQTLREHPATSIESAETTHGAQIVAREGRISVSGASRVSIYNTQGQAVQQNTRLPHGAYIIVADSQRFKVML